MSDTSGTPRSWLLDRPLSGFALPQGRFARLYGWGLLLNNAEQREVFGLLDTGPGQRVLEVGHGPGSLLKLIAETGAHVTGVEPSAAMRDMARRRLRAAVAAGRADLRLGTAEATGLPDQAFDLAVSVNNVPMWSDLTGGFRELHRVLRPGARLVVTWHGGTQPVRSARGLTLPEPVVERILAAMREVFGGGERRDLTRVVAFEAVRS